MKMIRTIGLFLCVLFIGTSAYSMKTIHRKKIRKKKRVKKIRKKRKQKTNKFQKEPLPMKKYRMNRTLPISMFAENAYDLLLDSQKIRKLREESQVEDFFNKLEQLLEVDQQETYCEYYVEEKIFNALLSVKEILRSLRVIDFECDIACGISFMQYLIERQKSSILTFILNLSDEDLEEICLDIHALGEHGRNLLHMACIYELELVVFALLERGVNPLETDKILNENGTFDHNLPKNYLSLGEDNHKIISILENKMMLLNRLNEAFNPEFLASSSGTDSSMPTSLEGSNSSTGEGSEPVEEMYYSQFDGQEEPTDF